MNTERLRELGGRGFVESRERKAEGEKLVSNCEVMLKKLD